MEQEHLVKNLSVFRRGLGAGEHYPPGGSECATRTAVV